MTCYITAPADKLKKMGFDAHFYLNVLLKMSVARIFKLSHPSGDGLVRGNVSFVLFSLRQRK